ncbi:hypothetical protein H4R21_005984 [Coemansia helicoidea]|uniref:Uncharacterized protein n=1 Tax=Coemansia helicoidea TaxID=1286919 RepID=A0ACC1KQE4_9FUNG|nr:hypothetical protein H4R21_005984 [Coemansia helicoidea]
MEGLQDAPDVFSDRPRKDMCLVNVGYGAVGGATAAELERVFGRHAGFERVVMVHGKPFSLVRFRSGDDAAAAHAAVHARACAELRGKVLFLEYVTAQGFARLAGGLGSPSAGDAPVLDAAHGVHYVPDFLSADDEALIMQRIRDDERREAGPWAQVQKRFVKHYGYAFDYRLKHIGDASLTASPQLPLWILPFVDRIQARLPACALAPDQLTVQRYPPGAGISFHADSHTAFAGAIAVLSLGTPVQMDFRDPATRAQATLDLCPRSLLVIVGEARLGWEHAIRARRSDLVDGHVRERAERWSITLRTVGKTLSCDCPYPALCDADAKLVRDRRQAKEACANT